VIARARAVVRYLLCDWRLYKAGTYLVRRVNVEPSQDGIVGHE
jgi:hypothetical protein